MTVVSTDPVTNIIVLDSAAAGVSQAQVIEAMNIANQALAKAAGNFPDSYRNVLDSDVTINSIVGTSIWSFPVVAGSKWIIEFAIIATAAGATNLVFRVDAPSGASGKHSAREVHGSLGVATAQISLASGQTVIPGNAGVIISTTAGNIDILVGNGTGTVATTIHAGSYIKATRIV